MIVQASVAMSVDGYIDDRKPDRLVLSHASDWDEVRRLRAVYDAVLVGAETVRRDNPALVTRDEALRQARIAQGMTPDPVKVTVSRKGDLDPASRFFTEGDSEKIVIVGRDAPTVQTDALAAIATIVRTPDPEITAAHICRLLDERGIGRLFVEGGSRMLTLFLAEGCVDYLRVAVAPFFVGDPQAPRVVNGGRFSADSRHRMETLRVAQVGDMTVTDYALNGQAADYARLLQAIRLAENCPASATAYSVGAVIVTSDKCVFTGYSRETAVNNHAEEEAVIKAGKAGASLEGAVIYSSMEPCSSRGSKPVSCSQLIIRHRMRRVVFAAREPDRFVDCIGEQLLRRAGIEVSVIENLSAAALQVNRHILR